MQVWTLGKVGAGDINVGVISDYIEFQARTRQDPFGGGESVDGERRSPRTECGTLSCKGVWKWVGQTGRLISRESGGLAKVTQWSRQNRAGLHTSCLPVNTGQ